MVESNGCEKWFRGRSDAVFPVVGESFCRASDERQLTVQKTSLFSHGDGFAVYEHHRWRQSGSPETGHDVGDVEEIGELVFRVDTYGDNSHPVVGKRSSAKDELVLMGPCGDCILTVRKKVSYLFSHFLILHLILVTYDSALRWIWIVCNRSTVVS